MCALAICYLYITTIIIICTYVFTFVYQNIAPAFLLFCIENNPCSSNSTLNLPKPLNSSQAIALHFKLCRLLYAIQNKFKFSNSATKYSICT